MKRQITFERLKKLVKESSGDDYDLTQRKINAQWEAFDSESKDAFCERLMQTLALAVARGRIKEPSVKYLVGEAAGWSESLHKTFMAGFEHQLKLAQSDIDDEDSQKLVKEGTEPDEPEVLTWRVFNKETGEEMANGTVEAKSTDIEAECKKWEDMLVYLYGDDVEAEVTRTLKRYLESKDVPEVHLEIDHKRDANGWTTGYIGVGDNCYYAEMKYFDKPSQFGIKRGRISKLWVADEDTREEILSYDRGWDVRPRDPESKAILKAILKEFN